jgi:hypothetical protein
MTRTCARTAAEITARGENTKRKRGIWVPKQADGDAMKTSVEAIMVALASAGLALAASAQPSYLHGHTAL